MKITKHISFFYLESRTKYINQIIQETNKYVYQTDVFIHTNNAELTLESFVAYTNGILTIVLHDLTNVDPFYLTWMSRGLMSAQKDDYDIFMYIEDDILVPNTAILYWLENSEKLIHHNYNLGFVRIEVEDDEEYITDLYGYGERMDTILSLDGSLYCVNNKNPYCAFWIYTRAEFNKFVSSAHYNLHNNTNCNYGIRERSAIGLHGTGMQWYKDTLIPIVDNTLTNQCKIFHLPNNYVMDKMTPFATVKFRDAVRNLP